MEPVVENVGLRFGFAALLAATFFGLIAFGAVAPGAMATPVFGAVPLSVVLAFAMIVFSVALTGGYVLLANRQAR